MRTKIIKDSNLGVRRFKIFEFKEPGWDEGDIISWIDYNDSLNLYSKNVHNHINYDIKAEDW